MRIAPATSSISAGMPVELIVLPARFHERDDAVLHLAGVGDGFVHQRGEDVARFAARQHRRSSVPRACSFSAPRLSM